MAVLEAARDNKFRSVSIDLIYGLPFQTVESFTKTLDRVIEVGPDRLSVFNYAHLPELFKPQRRIHAQDLPAAQVKRFQARVSVRGEEIPRQKLGSALRFDAGSALVRVTAEGFTTYEETLSLSGGARLEITPEMKPLKTNGRLQVTSAIAGAQVFVDSRPIGTVPTEVEVEAGSHEVTVRHSGHRTAKTTVVILARETKSIDVALERNPTVFSSWWFWTAVGTAAVAGTAIGFAVSTERGADSGDIPPGTLTVPF